jgi:hypothetical protein
LIQWRYEVIRPLVLFADRTMPQRAQETRTHPETVRQLRRRFRQRGMLGLLPADIEVVHRARTSPIPPKVREISGIWVNVVGFDTGTGLPSPIDHRDVPNLLWTGRFPMDFEALQKRLTTASLVLGPIAKTLPTFLEGRPPPVAVISVDVDLYSSTVDCLRLFEAAPSRLLPRVYCYFDDIHGYTYSDCNGERLAIAEFNPNHRRQQVCQIHGLKFFVPKAAREAKWVECFYIAHIFDHELYAQHSATETPEDDQRIIGLQ